MFTIIHLHAALFRGLSPRSERDVCFARDAPSRLQLITSMGPESNGQGHMRMKAWAVLPAILSSSAWISHFLSC